MSKPLSDEEREWKSLAMAKYRLFPNGLRLCVGRSAITGEQAIQEIQRETELGKLLVRVEKMYLQSIKTINWEDFCERSDDEKQTKPTFKIPHGQGGRFS